MVTRRDEPSPYIKRREQEERRNQLTTPARAACSRQMVVKTTSLTELTRTFKSTKEAVALLYDVGIAAFGFATQVDVLTSVEVKFVHRDVLMRQELHLTTDQR